jgi:hypothetical protein
LGQNLKGSLKQGIFYWVGINETVTFISKCTVFENITIFILDFFFFVLTLQYQDGDSTKTKGFVFAEEILCDTKNGNGLLDQHNSFFIQGGPIKSYSSGPGCSKEPLSLTWR